MNPRDAAYGVKAVHSHVSFDITRVRAFPFRIIVFIVCNNGGSKRKSANRGPFHCLWGEGVQMKWKGSQTKMFLDAWQCSLTVLMWSRPPRLSHTAVLVLLISSNTHFNSINRKHQPPYRHQHSHMRAHTQAAWTNKHSKYIYILQYVWLLTYVGFTVCNSGNPYF